MALAGSDSSGRSMREKGALEVAGLRAAIVHGRVWTSGDGMLRIQIVVCCIHGESQGQRVIWE